MLRTLGHLRDYLNEETLKFLPGNLQSGHFILLRESGKKDKLLHPTQLTEHDKQFSPDTFHTVVRVFDDSGTYIGTITHPDFWPSKA